MGIGCVVADSHSKEREVGPIDSIKICPALDMRVHSCSS